MSTFPYKGWGGGFLTSFLEISLWFFAWRPELWSSFCIKHQSGEKIISPLFFPAFFGHFFKNFLIGPCGVSKVINIRSGNSILDSIMHFPLSLYYSPPRSRIFPLQKAKEAFWLYYWRFLSDFLHAGLNCDLVLNQTPNGGKEFPPSFFPHFSSIFFKNFVLGSCGVSQVINIRSKNSILDSIMHFPLSLYYSPPPFPHFPPLKGQRSLLTLLLEISLWFFACRPELWSSFWIKHQSGEKIIFPLFFPAFFGHFFKNFVIGPCGVSKFTIDFVSVNSILDFRISPFPYTIPPLLFSPHFGVWF